jgi:plastocyanin
MNRTARVALVLAVALALAGPRAVAAPEPEALSGRALAGGKPMADVVVWLDAPSAPRPRERRFVVHQRNMQFEPRVLAAPVGSTVDLPNNDRVFHNVFSFTNGKPFDLGLYPTGASERITLDRAAVNRLSATSIRTWARTSWRWTAPTTQPPIAPAASALPTCRRPVTPTTRGDPAPRR